MSERITSMAQLPAWQRALIIAPAVASLGLAAGCSSEQAGEADASASASATLEPLSFDVTGQCFEGSNKGTLYNTSSGFTPNGVTQHSITQPDGTPYKGLIDSGVGAVDKNGESWWHWPCEASDQPGFYKGVITDFGADYKKGGGDDRQVSYSFHVADGTPN